MDNCPARSRSRQWDYLQGVNISGESYIVKRVAARSVMLQLFSGELSADTLSCRQGCPCH